MFEFFSNLFSTRYINQFEVLKSNHAELQDLQNSEVDLHLDKMKIHLRYKNKTICEIPRHELVSFHILDGNAMKIKKQGSVVGSAILGFIIGVILLAIGGRDVSGNPTLELQKSIQIAVFMIIGALTGLKTKTEYIGIQQVLKITWTEYGINRFVMLHLTYENTKEAKKNITNYYQLNEPIQRLPNLTPETLRLMNELELLNEKGEKLLNKNNQQQT